MEILTSRLPSGGYGYDFPSVRISPMTFIQVCEYIENVPSDPLDKYLYDIHNLVKEDERILDCYVMDLDFLIFYKKVCTVSEDLSYEITVKCPECGREIRKRINIEKDIKFKRIDEKIMEGAVIELGGDSYETRVPTVKEFLEVFKKYLVYRKITDLSLIKTIALIKNFETRGNQIESSILGATHSDITLLMALRDLYYDQVEPVHVFCPDCNKNLKPEERRSMTVSVDSLIVDFFRDFCINSPISRSKILFK